MTQNIYDNPDFFDGYSRLPRSVSGLDGAAEWPRLRAMLPSMAGRRVLDLGCGYGWFSRWARAAGAVSVVGVDVSEKMLARAAADTQDDVISYRRADLETVELAPAAYDLVYSSLALHYIVGLERLLAQVHGTLAPGGRFVFSAEHPLYTAPRTPKWSTDADGHKTWDLDGYLEEGPRRTDWIAKGVIKQHRSLGTYLTSMLRQGFALTHIEEWGPTDAQLAEHPEWALERQRPPFLLVAARRD
ncbi:MAG: methyltransferase domain-containing protein [Proteobacteria bacterium]|nr:methyltransferase domain-containing protein [Pseudomonadota bacterium]